MDLKDVDLNLIIVFNELLLERRVSLVANKLGVTQPAVSNALNRLRKLLDDNLFIRTARGMEPTPYALELAEPLAYALSTIHSTLNQRTVFDPASSRRKFTLGISDIGEINFLPKIISRLSDLAPHVSVSTLRNTGESLQAAMESGHVDLAVGLLPQLKTGYFQRRLYRQRYVCMFRKGHVLDKENVTEDEYAASEHLVVVPPSSGHAKVSEAIALKGLYRNLRLTVSHYVSVGYILAAPNNNMVATVPESYAKECAINFGLTYIEHPVAIPGFDINMFWHEKYHRDPGSKWMRRVMFELFSDSENAWGDFQE